MRLLIRRRPHGFVDGIALGKFQAGLIYDVGTQVGNVLLAEGWAEPAAFSSTPLPNLTPNRINALVLVVDDESDLRQLAAGLLTRHGYDVVVARHGLEALEQLCDRCPDLVVLDLNMPVMDGWQFRAAQQRLAEPQLVSIPVLLLTGVEDADAQAVKLNAAGVLKKPFDPNGLLDAVESALRAA